MKVGITGQSGFIGTHLVDYVRAQDGLELVPFEDGFFSDERILRAFVTSCDVVIHLAAASRMPSEDALYDLNVGLVQKVIDALELEHATPLVMFSSSTHETRDTAYGRAKLEGRQRFEAWARRAGASFVGFVFPNIYGPGARVHYASFIANFAWEIQHGQEPQILVDASMKLKYVGNLCAFIGDHLQDRGISRVEVAHDLELKVSDVLSLFSLFKSLPESVVATALGWDNNLKNLYRTFLGYRD